MATVILHAGLYDCDETMKSWLTGRLSNVGLTISSDMIDFIVRVNDRKVIDRWLSHICLWAKHALLRDYLMLLLCRYQRQEDITRCITNIYPMSQRLYLNSRQSLIGKHEPTNNTRILRVVTGYMTSASSKRESNLITETPLRCYPSSLIDTFGFTLFETCLLLIKHSGFIPITLSSCIMAVATSRLKNKDDLDRLILKFIELFPGVYVLSSVHTDHDRKAVFIMTKRLLHLNLLRERDFVATIDRLRTEQDYDLIRRLYTLLRAAKSISSWRKIRLFVRTLRL
jgi:hypothetical protein